MNLINLTTQDYPTSLYQVRQANPNVSFPDDSTDEDLAPFDFANVRPTPQPDYDQRIERIEEAPPEKVDGTYYQQWSIRAATPEETALYDLANEPRPNWGGFASEAMVNNVVNSLLSLLLSSSPGLYGGIVVGLGQAGQGDPTLFTSSWALLMGTGLVDTSAQETLQGLFTKYHISLQSSRV